MKYFVIKFMISYAAMLGTFCVIFFVLSSLTPVSEHFGIAIFSCIMSVTSLMVTNVLMTEKL